MIICEFFLSLDLRTLSWSAGVVLFEVCCLLLMISCVCRYVPEGNEDVAVDMLEAMAREAAAEVPNE